MKALLNKLFEQQRLSKAESKEVLIQMANEKYNTSQMASFLTVFLMRPISVDELAGFREALLELAVKIDFVIGDWDTNFKTKMEKFNHWKKMIDEFNAAMPFTMKKRVAVVC